MKNPWFVVKRYGIGLSPTWRGWLLIAAYLALMVVANLWFRRQGDDWVAYAIMVCLTMGVFIVMRFTSDGEPWRWRWGKDDS